MKKLLCALLASVAFGATLTLANDDFSYGVSDQGCYYFNESKSIVYSKDASLIGEVNYCKTLGSSLWYINLHQIERPDAYWNRIKIMKALRGEL